MPDSLPEECLSEGALKALATQERTLGASAEVTRTHVAGCTRCTRRLYALEHPSTARAPAADEETQAEGQAPASGSHQLAGGEQLGRYVLLHKLGEGGMGIVWAAYDPELDRKVAIKFLQRPDPQSTATVVREAQAMAKLAHPNVVAVHDVGVSDRRGAFMAMELVEGNSLRVWLQEGRHPAREVLEIFKAAGDGLSAAHAQGLVHYDFKPDNVLLGNDGRVQVMDFGLARQGDDARSASGALEGTPAYLAPEQLRGKPDGELTDQFSFAVALYEALYGVRPFRGSPLQRADATRWRVDEAPRDARVPLHLRKKLLRALSETPSARYPSMAALARDLARDPAVRWKRGGAVMAAVGVLALCVGLVRGAEARRQASCRGFDGLLRGVWDAQAPPKLAAALRSTLPASVAADVGQHVVGALDVFAGQWVSLRTEACLATRVRGEQSEEVMALRMDCLDARLQELKTLTEALQHPDASEAAHAAQSAHGLTPVSHCTEVQALKSRAQQATLAEQNLSTAKTLLSLGHFREAFTLGTDAAQAADRREAFFVSAEARLLEAQALGAQASSQTPAAFREAIAASYRVADESLFFSGMVKLLALPAEVLGEASLSPYVELGDQAAARTTSDPALRARWWAGRASLELRTHHEVEAARWAQRAVEAARGLPEVLDLTRAEVLEASAPALDFASGQNAATEAAEMFRRVLGAHAERTARALLALSRLHARAGDFAAAERFAAQGLAGLLPRPRASEPLTVDERQRESDRLLASALAAQGEAQTALGKLTEAERSFAVAETLLPRGDPRGAALSLAVRADRAYNHALSDAHGAAPEFGVLEAEALHALPPTGLLASRIEVGAEVARAAAAKKILGSGVAHLQALLARQRKNTEPGAALETARTQYALARWVAKQNPETSAQFAKDAEATFRKLNRLIEAARVAVWRGQQR